MTTQDQLRTILGDAATSIDNLTTDIGQIVDYVIELKNTQGDVPEDIAALAESLKEKAAAADKAAEAAKKASSDPIEE